MFNEKEIYGIGDIIEGNLKLVQVIGEGALGIVFLAENVDLNFKKYAVKRLEKSKMDMLDQADYKMEVSVMMKLSGHPNIVKYISHFETEIHHYLVMEHCETDLFDSIFLRCGFPIALVKRFFSDISRGLDHAHKNGIYHRDIKPENVLITGDGGVAKLADFGLSTQDKYTDDFGVGSVRYMAPECFGHCGEDEDDSGIGNDVDCYNAPAADIWAMGILLMNMMYGRCPWYEATQSDKIFQQYTSNDPQVLKKNLNLTKALDDFLRANVFNLDPEKRCDINEFDAFVSSQKTLTDSDDSAVVRRQLECVSTGSQVTILHMYHANDEAKQAQAVSKFSLDDILSFTQTRGSCFDMSSLDARNNTNMNWSIESQFGSLDSGNKLTVSSVDISSPFIETRESRIQLAKQLFVPSKTTNIDDQRYDMIKLGMNDSTGFKLTEVIGEGATATVFLAEDLHQVSTKYAIKRFKKDGMDAYDIADYKREVYVLKKLSGHPNIVKYIDEFETTEHYFLVLEHCETDLFDSIFIRGGFPSSLVQGLFSDIASALEFIHQNGIFHRDIKPENILITDNGRTAKLADFGLATFERYTNEFGVGSDRYMAPECMETGSDKSDSAFTDGIDCYCSPAVDVWAIGVLLINMIFGKNPWHIANTSDLIFSAYIGSDPYILKRNLKLTSNLDNFLRQKVFNLDPEMRCSVKEFKTFVALQDSFVECEDEIIYRNLECVTNGNEIKIYHQLISGTIKPGSLNDMQISHTPNVCREKTIGKNECRSQNIFLSNLVGSLDSIGKLTIPSNGLSSPLVETRESRTQLVKKFGIGSSSTSIGRCKSQTIR